MQEKTMPDLKLKGEQVNPQGFFSHAGENDLDWWDKLADFLIVFCKFTFIVSKCLKSDRALCKFTSRHPGNASSLLLGVCTKTAKPLTHCSIISISGFWLLRVQIPSPVTFLLEKGEIVFPTCKEARSHCRKRWAECLLIENMHSPTDSHRFSVMFWFNRTAAIKRCISGA